MDNAHDILVDGNYLYSKNTSYYRSGYPATGILVGAETWPVCPLISQSHVINYADSPVPLQQYPQPTYNVTLQNNLLVRTGGISSFQENNVNLIPII